MVKSLWLKVVEDLRKLFQHFIDSLCQFCAPYKKLSTFRQVLSIGPVWISRYFIETHRCVSYYILIIFFRDHDHWSLIVIDKINFLFFLSKTYRSKIFSNSERSLIIACQGLKWSSILILHSNGTIKTSK